jgi:formimidoylglutamate deiminase
MRRLHAAQALLPEGWVGDVTLGIAADGTIAQVYVGRGADGAERTAGPLVPGMPNLHSHAFQRALAGRTGRANRGGDSFWTWRQAMYAFLDRVDADAFEAVAAQAYVEMLRAGYTGVAEFHYVHHDPAGDRYADPAELSRRIVAAAAASGIALTLLPVFYAHAGFGGQAPVPGQRRFVLTIDEHARLVAALTNEAARNDVVVGVAPHSLRAVTPDELARVVAAAPAGAPIHIHAAEQQREVADCVAWSGRRPVEWLLEHAGVDARWCVIHATHLVPRETAGLAASGAVAGLAPTTEADLGDGTFAGRAYLDANGAFGIGSDSNTCIDPFVELRQLEWSQRLARCERNVLAPDESSAVPIGQWLYAAAAGHGARALGRPTGAIAVGARADLVVLNELDPGLAGQPVEDVLDAAIFGPARRPVRDVMVGGRWVVRDGRHRDEEAILARYSATLARLQSA